VEGSSKIVITGASGALGRRTAELLAEQGAAERLILVTRNPDALADLAAKGADVRRGDFDEPDGLPEAFTGGERMLLISASDLDRRTEQHRAAIAAAAAAGVRHVAYTSCLRPEPPNPAAIAPSHHATEEALRASGLDWTILRNSFYSEYQVPEAARVAESGQLVHNRGDGRIAYVSREDCAAAAAAVLAGPGHDGRVYDITGPEAFSAADLAALYGELHQASVEAVSLDDEAFITTLMGGDPDAGHLRYGAELFASFGRAIREGYLDSCTEAVATLTGRPARSLQEVLEG
jgi:NAD(P)H dehydrogenase (quinone)